MQRNDSQPGAGVSSRKTHGERSSFAASPRAAARFCLCAEPRSRSLAADRCRSPHRNHHPSRRRSARQARQREDHATHGIPGEGAWLAAEPCASRQEAIHQPDRAPAAERLHVPARHRLHLARRERCRLEYLEASPQRRHALHPVRLGDDPRPPDRNGTVPHRRQAPGTQDVDLEPRARQDPQAELEG